MVMPQEHMLSVGASAPPFSLPATDSSTYSLGSFSDAAVLVVIFTCNHCPYAVALEDRFVALQRDYADKDVRLVAINPNNAKTHPGDSFDAMAVRAKEKGFNFPYLRDESQDIARAYGAVCTPDPFVFDSDRKLVYAGRVDDSWKDEAKVKSRDLRTAIDACLESRPHGLDVHQAIGCSIKWK